MDSKEKKSQILQYAEAFGIRRPKGMPSDFVTAKYAEGLEDAGEYAYRAAQSVMMHVVAGGRPDAYAKDDLKTVLNIWSTLAYEKALLTEPEISNTLYDIRKVYNKGLITENLRNDVQSYLKKTAEGLRAMQDDPSCIVGQQNKRYYTRAVNALTKTRDYVLAVIEINTPEANECAKKIVYGGDGKSGIAAFRKGVADRMAPPVSLIEDATREARRWSNLISGNTKKIKKKEAVQIDYGDTFALYAAMPNLGAKLKQFTAAVDSNRLKLERKLEKKQRERIKLENDVHRMEESCLEYRQMQLNGEIPAAEALKKVKDLRRRIEAKERLLDSNETEELLEAALEANAELYGAVGYLRALWEVSEAILTTEERYELFAGFPYAAILNVLQGGTEQENLVRQEIYVARDGINRKIEQLRAGNRRFEKLYSQARRTGVKTERKVKETTAKNVDKDKAAEAEMDALFGSRDKKQIMKKEKKAEKTEKKLEDLLV